MTCVLQNIAGESYDIRIDGKSKVGDAKRQIAQQKGVPFKEIDFLFGGRILEDSEMLNSIRSTIEKPIIVHISVDFQPKMGIAENEEIINKEEEKPKENPKNKPKSEETPTKKQTSAEEKKESPKEIKETPQNRENKTYRDPPNFEQLIGELLELGFDYYKSIDALRECKYNSENAINMILNSASSSAPAPTKEPEPSKQQYSSSNSNNNRSNRNSRNNNKKKNNNGIKRINQYSKEQANDKFKPYVAPHTNTLSESDNELLFEVRECDRVEFKKLMDQGVDFQFLLGLYNDCEQSIAAVKSILM